MLWVYKKAMPPPSSCLLKLLHFLPSPVTHCVISCVLCVLTNVKQPCCGIFLVVQGVFPLCPRWLYHNKECEGICVTCVLLTRKAFLTFRWRDLVDSTLKTLWSCRIYCFSPIEFRICFLFQFAALTVALWVTPITLFRVGFLFLRTLSPSYFKDCFVMWYL